MNLDQEKAEYEQLREECTEDIIPFLLSSKHILYNTELRLEIYERYTYDKEVLDKIVSVEQEIQDQVPKTLKKLGGGNYGCVVFPALPDKIDGEWVNFPNCVSKLFFIQKDAEKALKTSEEIHEIFGVEEYKMNKYNISYAGFNFPLNFGFASRQDITVLRMPFLGTSVLDLNNYKEFRKLPVLTIFFEILKLLKQVLAFKEKGYIHGDIRQGNVMADPLTGALNLIDFDWFYPKQVFFKNYSTNLGFYSNPPESLLNPSVGSFLRGFPLQLREHCDDLIEYVGNHKNLHFRRFMNKVLTEEIVRIANFSNIEQLRFIESKQDYYEAIWPTFDSFGLGIALLEFCVIVYPYGTDLKSRLTRNGEPLPDEEIALTESHIRRLYDEILLPMIDLQMKKRLTIELAVEKMEKLQEDFMRGLHSI